MYIYIYICIKALPTVNLPKVGGIYGFQGSVSAAIARWNCINEELQLSMIDPEEPASPTTARQQAWGEADADILQRTPCFGGRTQLYSVAFVDMFSFFVLKFCILKSYPFLSKKLRHKGCALWFAGQTTEEDEGQEVKWLGRMRSACWWSLQISPCWAALRQRVCQDISGTFRVFSSMNIEGSEKKHALQRKICLNTAQSCTILHTELCIRIEKVCAIPISGARLQSWKSSKAPVHLCQV